MKRMLISLVFLSGLVAAQTASELNSSRVLLPNGWAITPVGKQINLGDLPLNIAVSKDKNLLAVTNNGQSRQNLQLIDVQSEKIISDVDIDKSWYGLGFSATENFSTLRAATTM